MEGISDGYTVKDAYRALISNLSFESNRNFVRYWHKLIPLKVSLFAWRVLHKTSLARR